MHILPMSVYPSASGANVVIILQLISFNDSRQILADKSLLG